MTEHTPDDSLLNDTAELSSFERRELEVQAAELDVDDDSLVKQGVHRVDLVMMANLRLLRHDLRQYSEELQGMREDLRGVKTRNRLIGSLIGASAVVLIAVLVAVIVLVNYSRDTREILDTRGQARSLQSCDNYGAQLVIYRLLEARSKGDTVAQIDAQSAINSTVALRNKLQCPDYEFLDPSTGKRTLETRNGPVVIR